MNRRPASAIVTVALVALISVGGCGVPTQKHPTVLDDDGVPAVAPESSTSLPDDTESHLGEVCLISGDHLVTVAGESAGPLSVRYALQALADASDARLPAGTRTAVSHANVPTALGVRRGVAQVEMSAGFSELAEGDRILAFAQIVCTLTGLPGVGQVHFMGGGEPVDIPRADGSLTREPVSRFDYRQLLHTK